MIAGKTDTCNNDRRYRKLYKYIHAALVKKAWNKMSQRKVYDVYPV